MNGLTCKDHTVSSQYGSLHLSGALSETPQTHQECPLFQYPLPIPEPRDLLPLDMVWTCSGTQNFPKLDFSCRPAFPVFQTHASPIHTTVFVRVLLYSFIYWMTLLLAANSFSSLVSKDVFAICGGIKVIQVLKSSHCPITSILLFLHFKQPCSVDLSNCQGLFSCFLPWSALQFINKREVFFF